MNEKAMSFALACTVGLTSERAGVTLPLTPTTFKHGKRPKEVINA